LQEERRLWREHLSVGSGLIGSMWYGSDDSDTVDSRHVWLDRRV
jgi:hypothetical protein